MYSDPERRNLAARALPLQERWRAGIEARPDAMQAERRLEAWRHVLSVDGDLGILSRRLAFDGLDPESCISSLGCVRLVAAEPVPEWIGRLEAVLEHRCRDEPVRALSGSACAEPETLSADEPAWAQPIASAADTLLPFWPVWAAFVTAGTAELRARAGDSLENVSEEALCSFQWQLLGTLAHIGALPLALKLRRFVAEHDPLSLLARSPPDAAPAPRELYRVFVDRLRGVELHAFLHEYAVLARLVARVSQYWTEHVAEFCRRLEEDRGALADLFHGGLDPGAVVHIQCGLSDAHHRRRDVVIATFACGLRIVYKPKDLGADEAFSSFVAWVNAQTGGILDLGTLTVLNRRTHGWVEFVEHRACRSEDEVQRYYRRMGMLLCVAYVLGATDLHQENIIADGEQPLLLDLETLLQPLPRPWDGLYAGSADERAVEIMHESVLRTGLLPFWIIGNPGKSYDVSGIGAEPSDTGYLHAHWEHINSDWMQLVYRSRTTQPQANRPTLNGNDVSAEDHVEEMIDGFRALYRVLLVNREVLLVETGPLRQFRGLQLRCLLRMTKAYAQILNRRLHPEFLRDGAESGIELERLARDFVVSDPAPAASSPWGIYRAEIEALERFDIPFFSFFSDSDALFADGRVVAPAFFAQTGMQRLSACVRRLSEPDLRVQTDFIRASLHARYGLHAERLASPQAGDCSAAEPAQPTLTREQSIAGAVAIAEAIRRSAIRGEDGGITWLSMAFDPTVDRMNALPMSDSFYDGRVGVAFFLAALEHVAGAGFRELALASLLPLRKVLQQRVPPLTRRITLGAAAGLGGEIYALVRIAGWLRDDELLELAARAASWFVRKRIACDDALDVFGGAAGGILGLLSLSTAAGNGDALSAAVECGDHLLEKRVRAQTGHCVWPGSWVARPLTGFGHGAAGIGYALLRLSAASAHERFRAAAEEAIAYETAVYSEAARNWPDLRYAATGNGHRFMVAWCNGAAGIGLGRLGGLHLSDGESVRRDIANALETTRAAPLAREDHVCCGNLGRLDLLVEGARRLSRPGLLDEARRRAAVLVQRAERNGRYGLFAQVPGVTDSFSLFQGTAGIGYELLRLADPHRMPCALLWE